MYIIDWNCFHLVGYSAVLRGTLNEASLLLSYRRALQGRAEDDATDAAVARMSVERRARPIIQSALHTLMLSAGFKQLQLEFLKEELPHGYS